MEQKPYLIVSDIHLGAVPDRTERAFRAFLDHAAERASGMLINGDLFDFWFEYRSVIPARHYRVLAALTDLVEAGVPVRFIGGNHDAWTGPFLRDTVGLEVLDGPVELSLAGRRTLAVHGDGVGEGDVGYGVLRRILRSRIATMGFRILHPDIGDRIARVASSTEARVTGKSRPNRNRSGHIERWAVGELEGRPDLELLVAGHAHEPAVRQVGENQWYVNAGDWIQNFTYIALPPGGGSPEMRRWEP